MPKLLRVLKHLFRRFILHKPRTVRIVAAGPATRSFCPWDDKAEIWSLNRFWRARDEKTGEPWLKRWDRWFEVHQPEVHGLEQHEQDPNELHEDWLKSEHDFPIYFLQEAEKYPSGVHYPIETIGPEFDWYLSSSIAYMMALAIHEGFDRIELYGVEMPQGSDYFWQRPNMMWLIGRAEGEFIDVYIPPGSTLKREPMYAYESNEVNYDNWLRRELHTVKRHGYEIDKHYRVYSGVVQGVRAAYENVSDRFGMMSDEVVEELKLMFGKLLNHHKAEARKLELASNQMQAERRRIIKELSYRDTPIGADDMDVTSGGTNLQLSLEYADGLSREEE